MRRLLLLPILLQLAAAQTFTLSGTVKDAATGEPLPAATVRLVGLSQGTIANANGAYTIQLEPDSYTIAFSFIGYRSDTVAIQLDRNKEVHVALDPSSVQIAEMVVDGEDPAMAIMRNVIERKQHWVESLHNYQFEAFSRQVLRRDTAIASITESYSTGYWRRGDTLREVIKQKRQTENVPGAQNFSQVGGIANFYQDTIRLMGFQFLGPTARDAFGYYAFKLERTRSMGGSSVYEIRVTPKSRIRPLFNGTITILEEGYAVIGVDVVPNEAFNIPMLSELSVRYRQQFSQFQDRYWMPVDIRVSGVIQIGLTGINFPKIAFEAVSAITDYRVNGEIPDSVFEKPRRIELEDAKKTDSTYWALHEVVPLTTEEQSAYKKLDSTQTLEKQFKPSGALMAVGEASGSGLKYLDLRFDRVEGLFLGGSIDEDSVTNRLRLHAAAGRGFADLRNKWSVGAEYFLDSTRRTSVYTEAFDQLGNIPDEDYYQQLMIGLSALLYKEDYRDYYYSKGWRLGLKVRPMRRLRLNTWLQNEQTSAAVKNTDYSFFYRANPFRLNIPTVNGSINSLVGTVRYGQDKIPLNIVHVDGVELELEHSASSLGSDFNFTRAVVRADYRIVTSLRSLFLPPSLNIKFFAGVSSGVLPSQRMFGLESRYSSFETLGALKGAGVREFGGDQAVLLSVEHNFRNLPWLALDIPFLYKNSIEVITYATVARSWMEHASFTPFTNSTSGWYAEAGVGISRIFGLLRVNGTYRFAQPQQFVLTFSVAQVF